jgi:hypothetical protein
MLTLDESLKRIVNDDGDNDLKMKSLTSTTIWECDEVIGENIDLGI